MSFTPTQPGYPRYFMHAQGGIMTIPTKEDYEYRKAFFDACAEVSEYPASCLADPEPAPAKAGK